ncbi:MAG: hypothetical protein K5773_00295 [Pseudobutyrivibrio sp.]|nr:hypothetical protein [Pseudobutyrivibrio sp.]
MGMSDRINRMPGSVLVCVDNEKFGGKLYHCFSETPVEFCDLPDLFVLLERVADEVGYPEAKTRPRFFKKTGREDISLGIMGQAKVCFPKDLLVHKGKIGTFMISVISRDFSSLQGLLYNQMADVTVNFDSEVHLTRIINEAITK